MKNLDAIDIIENKWQNVYWLSRIMINNDKYIAIDNWVKTRDGWLIGISCKRTLRERWKLVSSADANILSKYKIKYIYHVVTFDEDLSDDKLTLLGGNRHIFYLPDNSRRLKHAVNHVGLKEYVRPISQLINDIKKIT